MITTGICHTGHPGVELGPSRDESRLLCSLRELTIVVSDAAVNTDRVDIEEKITQVLLLMV